jgi:hypothetical protein
MCGISVRSILLTLNTVRLDVSTSPVSWVLPCRTALRHVDGGACICQWCAGAKDTGKRDLPIVDIHACLERRSIGGSCGIHDLIFLDGRGSA